MSDKKDRVQEPVQPSGVKRVQQARKAGPHGKVQNSSGTSHATPNKQHQIDTRISTKQF